MKKEIRKEQSELDITLKIEGKEVESAINKTLVRFQKNMTIKGFRKGMAPLDRVRASLKQEELLGHSLDSLLQVAAKQAAELIKDEDQVLDGPTYKIIKYTPSLLEVMFTYPTRPTFDLKDFKSLDMKFEAAKPKTDELVANEIKLFEQRHAKWEKVTDKAKLGDKIKVDLKSDVIKYNVEEKSFKDFEIVLGKGVLLKEFEDQMIGSSIGEKKEIKITLPNTHTIEVLRDKEVIYEFVINSIERLIAPTINDEMVKTAKIKDINTVAEFKKYLADLIEKRESANAKGRFVQEVLNKLRLESKLHISPIIVNNEASRTLQQFKQNLERQKVSFKKWLHDNHMEETRLMEMYRVQALNRLTETLILAEIAKKENIKNSDEEINAKYEQLAKEQNLPLEMAKKFLPKENVSLALTNEKVIDLITKHFNK